MQKCSADNLLHMHAERHLIALQVRIWRSAICGLQYGESTLSKHCPTCLALITVNHPPAVSEQMLCTSLLQTLRRQHLVIPLYSMFTLAVRKSKTNPVSAEGVRKVSMYCFSSELLLVIIWSMASDTGVANYSIDFAASDIAYSSTAVVAQLRQACRQGVACH